MLDLKAHQIYAYFVKLIRQSIILHQLFGKHISRSPDLFFSRKGGCSGCKIIKALMFILFSESNITFRLSMSRVLIEAGYTDEFQRQGQLAEPW